MKSQTPQEIINKCFYDQSIKVIKLIYENSEKQELDIDELEEEFKNFWENNDNKIKVNPEKEKQKRKVKELSEEEKCIAAKKDGNRCNGKRFIKGDNPLLCSLHNNNGMNFGSYDNPIKSEEKPLQKKKEKTSSKKEEISLTCKHVFLRGNRKGESCGNLAVNNKDNCKLHNTEPQEKIKKNIEEFEEEFEEEFQEENLEEENDLFGDKDKKEFEEEFEEDFN